MSLSRRRFIRLGLAAGAVLVPTERAVALGLKGLLSGSGDPTSPRVPSFSVPLPISPVIRPLSSTATSDTFQITQRMAQRQILPPPFPPTTIWGYNGITPGPTFRVMRGREAVVRQVNRLPVPVVVHLHGADVPAASDGYPLDVTPPGGSKEYFYPNVQQAASLWYHDHSIDLTGRDVYMGLAGFYIITDDVEQALPLPKGQFDIPIMIQDKLFNADGSLVFQTDDGVPLRQGNFGDVILANGAAKPFLRVSRRKYRFRFLGGSNARIYRLALSTGEPLTVIGTDGGLLPHPVVTPDLILSICERYSVIIDFSRYRVGTKVVLQNTFEHVPGDPFDPELTRDVMRFDVVADADDRSSVPSDLVPLPDLPESSAVRTRDWEFGRSDGQWVINGKPFDPNRIDAFPALGSTEIWRFINDGGGWVHPIHPHVVQFLILDRNGVRPRPYEVGRKDVVFLGPGDVARVIMKFVDFKGQYVMHCHNLAHEDNMMMTQFKVV